MPVIGPNCYGMLDCRTGMHLWSSAVLERLEVPGIGPTKAERYGDELLELINTR